MSHSIRNAFGGSADALMSPHLKRRRPVSFLVVFAMIFFGIGISLWSAWAGKWPMPADASFWQAWGIGGKITAWALSGGMLFPQFAHNVLGNISTAGLAGVLACKAVLCAGASGALGWFAAKGALVPRDAYEHIRGARLYDGADAPKMLARALMPGNEPFFHPDFKVARPELGNGVLCFGSPGSGKTSIWLPQIKKALDRGEYFMSLDVKKEQIQKLGKGVHFLAPWLRGSLVLDIGADITTFAQAEAFANNLVRINPNSSHGKVWEQAANAVFAALVKHLVATKPLRWTWKDLADLLEQDVDEWLKILKSEAPSIAKILDVADATKASVVFNIATDLRKLSVVAQLFVECEKFGGERFSIRRWMTENDYPYKGVVLTFDRENESAVGFLVPFVLDYIGMMISGLPNNTNTPRTFFLDEIAQVPAVNSLREYLEVGRSRGIMTILACQDYAQLELGYGKQVADVLYSNASIKVIARTTASQAQAHIAQSFGNREVSFKSISQSTSAGGLNSSSASQEKTLPVILPGQLGTEIGPVGKVSDGKGGTRPSAIRALLAPMSGDIYKLDWPLIPFEEIRKAPKPLPSQHKFALAVKQILDEEGASLADRIRCALAEIAIQDFNISDFELLGLLYSFDYLTKAQMEQCKKVGFDAYTTLLDASTSSAKAATPMGDEGDDDEMRALDDLLLNHASNTQQKNQQSAISI